MNEFVQVKENMDRQLYWDDKDFLTVPEPVLQIMRSQEGGGRERIVGEHGISGTLSRTALKTVLKLFLVPPWEKTSCFSHYMII